MSAPSSEYSSDSESLNALESLLGDEVMYHVLGQFLMTSTGDKNVATCLQDISSELKGIREALGQIAARMPTPSSQASS